MEAVDSIAEPKGLPAYLEHNLGSPVQMAIKASMNGKCSQQPVEKDLPAEGDASFRSEKLSDEGGRSSFCGVTHPPEPIDVDIMKTVYAAIDEKSEPPGCLLRGLSVKGPTIKDLSIRVTGVKPNVVVGAGSDNGLVEEQKAPSVAVPQFSVARVSDAVEAESSTQDSEEECVWDPSLPPSGNVSPHSSIDSNGVATAVNVMSSCTSTYRSEVLTSGTMLTMERTCESMKGSIRGDSVESAETSLSRASGSSTLSDDSNWSNITGSDSKPHRGMILDGSPFLLSQLETACSGCAILDCSSVLVVLTLAVTTSRS